jgi:hypothetical protein
VASQTPAQRALTALHHQLAGKPGWAAADWALTLHMLERLAPRFFVDEHLSDELDHALEALTKMPRDFPSGLDGHEAMARVDAVYLRMIRGVSHRPLDVPSLASWIDANATAFPLQAWFMRELATQLGAELPAVWTNRYPFKASSPTTHLYMLTHELMLATQFFTRPLTTNDGLDQLADAVPAAISDRDWDLAAELAFTLRFAGLPADQAVAALITAQKSDGSMGEGASPRETAHLIATALLALAPQP